MTKGEALKLALEALDIVKIHYTQNRHVNEAITAIKKALAQPEQEPFGYFRYDLRLDAWVQNRAGITGTPFYTTPPQRTWVGLKDEEKSELWVISRAALPRYATFASLIEAKLKERNT